MSRSIWILAIILSSLALVQPYKIEKLSPEEGPLSGDTKVNVYSSEFHGLNYTDFPHPKCQFGTHYPMLASWVHCYGFGDQKTETCLVCMSPYHGVNETVDFKVSLKGDFSDTLTHSFFYYTDPVVYYSVPFIGYKYGGTFVQVFGEHFMDFGDNLKCAFGTVFTDAKFVSSTLITCRSPPSDVVDAPIPLKVTQNLQQSSATYINYYFYTPPEISQLIPSRGPNTGGTFVIIKGKMLHPFKVSQLDFYNTTFVRFGPDNLIKVNLINNTHATVISPPAGIEGHVPVEITFNDQEWSHDGILFFYYTPPYVFQIVPEFGTVQGGTNVTVIGANLIDTGTLTCKFGKKVVPAYYIDSSHAWCITPGEDHPQYVDFGLALWEDNYSGDNIQYLYMETPIISNIYPLCGPTSGLTQLTIVGKNFVYIGPDKAFCIFNGTIYEPVTIINDTLLYCDSPSVLDKHGYNVNGTTEYTIALTINSADIVKYDRNFTYYEQPHTISIFPFQGPISGGTNVSVKGDDYSQACNLTVRFGTIYANATLGDDGEVKTVSPAVTCPGQVYVQVSLNGQQYIVNEPETDLTTFTYFEDIIVSYSKPDKFPTNGGSLNTIYGYNFLFGRNSTLNDDGSERIHYKIRYIDDSGNVLAETDDVSVRDNQIQTLTPAVDHPVDTVYVEVSPNNGQDWYRCENKVSFVISPSVTSISPGFGIIKHRDKLTATGKNLDCDDPTCPLLKCSFSTDEFRILTEGTRIDSNTVICDIPSVSRPEVTLFQITTNGYDFTTDEVYYTFYDALVYQLVPELVPLEGNTTILIKGYGFAYTDQLKTKLQFNGKDLFCGTEVCTFPASYIDSKQLTFVAPPEANVKDYHGQNIRFNPFAVEVSIYGDSFTNNNITLLYYEQPDVGPLTSDGSRFKLHSNSSEIIHVPVHIKIPDGTDPEEFIRKTIIKCKYQVGDEVKIVDANLINYPFPKYYDINNDQAIDCPIPSLLNTGNATLSIAINGQNFAGDLPVFVEPQLQINNIGPQCGRIQGGTPVTMSTEGFTQDDLGKLFFTWSTVCTPQVTKDILIGNGTFGTRTPPAQYQNTPGGVSLVVFSVEKNEKLVDGSLASRIHEHFESGYEFLYYRDPNVLLLYPHSADYRGGTPIIVEGAFFFTDPEHRCTPKCKFGQTTVEAEWLSTVQLRCISPPTEAGAHLPFSITYNGAEEIPLETGDSFTFTAPPTIYDISPRLGPSTGGTLVVVTGANFTDMSRYPKEFACVFKSMQLNMEPKRTPAAYVNSTTLLCTTPGGWETGHMATIEVTYNGIQITDFNNTFRFYHIDDIWPRAGPSCGDSKNRITIRGSGFNNSETVACQLGGKTVQATFVNWTHIQCPIPPNSNGEDYFGKSDLLYTFNGIDWIMVVDGFSYYQQPEVVKLTPNFIPKTGGTIAVSGRYMREDFFGHEFICKIGNTVGEGIIIDAMNVRCKFPPLDTDTRKENHLLISQNGLSFIEANNINLIHVFDVANIQPRSGIIEGGTSIHVIGSGYPVGQSPICRFGVPGRNAYSYGQQISENEVICNSPVVDLPEVGGYPFELPFSLSFSDPSYDTWSRGSQTFYYYPQTSVGAIDPTSAVVNQNILVTVVAANQFPFAPNVIGSDVTYNDKVLQSEIECRWGRFGTTKGVLTDARTINCPTPTINAAVTEFTEESVVFQLAINGQDFTPEGSQSFKFLGSKSSAIRGIAWVVAIILGGGVLVFLLYLLAGIIGRKQGGGPAAQ